MELYDVLVKERDEMDSQTKRICSIILQEAFYYNEMLPSYLVIKNFSYKESKEKLNSFLNKIGLEVVDIEINFNNQEYQTVFHMKIVSKVFFKKLVGTVWI